MVVSGDLFELIKSLSSSEKRYFRLFISIHEGEKDYAKLFDAIEILESYDEEYLKKKFRGEAFIKRFSATKNYLYRQILRSLRAYHSGSSLSITLREELHSIELLHRKGLIRQADKLLRRARKLARQYDKGLLLLELLQTEADLSYSAEAGNNVSYGDFEKILLESESVLRRLLFENDLYQLKFRLSYDFTHEDRVRSEEYYDEKIRELEAIPEGDLSIMQSVEKYTILGLRAMLRSDLEAHYRHFRSAYRTLTENFTLAQEDAHGYISIAFYYIQAQYHLRKFDEMFSTIAELRTHAQQHPAAFRTLQAKIFFSTAFWEIFTLIGLGETNRAEKIIPTIERGLRTFAKQIPEYFGVMLELFMAMACFSSGDLRKSLIKLNFVLTKKKVLNEGGYEYYTMALLLNLMIHFELGNRDLLEAATDSVRRFLRESAYALPFTAGLIFSFFTQALKSGSRPEELRLLGALKEEALKGLSETAHRAYINRMGIIPWIERCEQQYRNSKSDE